MAFLYSGTCSLWHLNYLNHCAFQSYSIDFKNLSLFELIFILVIYVSKEKKIIEFPVVFVFLSVCIKRLQAKLHLHSAIPHPYFRIVWMLINSYLYLDGQAFMCKCSVLTLKGTEMFQTSLLITDKLQTPIYMYTGTTL